ncbi:conjugal transfer protein TraN (plasmid) [Aliarcobacter butzleri]|uniref:conjugal transfer protein TraN n=1 Tax=Aliarcobacter butzleri TaxID=28197 RepID=UPI003B287A95
MKTIIFFLLLATSLFGINCGDFQGEFKTYNGHYYAITGNKMSFEVARKFAEANNGYLAIPNNAGENNFIKTIIGNNNEAWLGIYDPNYTKSYCYTANCFSTSRTRFKTVQGASLLYQNWDSKDVENQLMENDGTVDKFNKPIISLLGEHWVLMSGNTGLWRDWGNHFIEGQNPTLQKAIIEFDSKPICYENPTNITDEISGRVCNSQIWDTVLGVTDGTTMQCLEDINKIEYCPQSLSPCGQNWDYTDGYAVSGVGQVVDYTKKETTIKYEGEPTINIVEYSYDRRETWRNELWCKSSYWKQVFGSKCAVNINGMSSSILEKKCSELGGTFYTNHNSYFMKFICSKNVCPNGEEPVNGKCATSTTKCPIGYTETVGAETSKGECKSNQNYTYYKYICDNGYSPIDSGGNSGKSDTNNTIINDLSGDLNSPTPPQNNCKKEKFTCLANEKRPCALVDNVMQCSPFPCIGNTDIENVGTIEGENDKNNDGWKNDGSCAGQLYIFNGEDKRCRSKDKLFGLTGGGCCDKDKVFMGLIGCKDKEKILAKKRKNDVCYYVGDYCSKKIPLLGCIQTSESYCCFNSKLARIIHEQGRPQLKMEWGSPESPNCKGFTPDEFQKLDFSKIDFTEFAKDIQQKTTNFKNIGNFVQNKVEQHFTK